MRDLRRDVLPRLSHGIEHLAGILEALDGVLRQGLLHQLHEDGREVGHPASRRLRVVLEDLEEHRVHRVRLEGLVDREELVEDGADGEDVGAHVHLLATNLLGRHVVGSSHHHARLGDVGGAQPRETEVHDLHLPVGQDVYVGGLQVSVDDLHLVGEGEPIADLLHDAHLLVEGDRGIADDVLEVGPLEKLHRHVGAAVFLSEVVDRDDVGMIEAGRRLRLALKPLTEVFVGPALGRHGLDGDVPVQDRVVGLEHEAHRPLTELPDDLVLTDSIEVHQRSSIHRVGDRSKPSLRCWKGR